jgi:hypothetical protein
MYVANVVSSVVQVNKDRALKGDYILVKIVPQRMSYKLPEGCRCVV